MENTTTTLLNIITKNIVINKLTEPPEQSSIISTLLNIPFFTQLISDLGHEIIKQVLSKMTTLTLRMKENATTNDNTLYFLLKGEIYAESSSFKEYTNTVDGPLNFANRNASTLSNKNNIIPITFHAVNHSAFLLVDINSIFEAKTKVNNLDVNELRRIDMLTRHLSRLQSEKINKYFIRKQYRKHDKVYKEGDNANKVYFIIKGEFLLSKKRKFINNLNNKLEFVNNELNLLSKQSNLYNFCLNGGLTLNDRSVVNIHKQLEEEKSTLYKKDIEIETNEDIINLVVIRDNDCFGEIEMFKHIKLRTHTVTCLSERAELLLLNFNYIKSLCPREMIAELEQCAVMKAKVINEKFQGDCEAIDSEKRDKAKTMDSNSDNDSSIRDQCHQHSYKKIRFHRINRNDNDDKQTNLYSNIFKSKKTYVNIKKLPPLNHNGMKKSLSIGRYQRLSPISILRSQSTRVASDIRCESKKPSMASLNKLKILGQFNSRIMSTKHNNSTENEGDVQINNKMNSKIKSVQRHCGGKSQELLDEMAFTLSQPKRLLSKLVLFNQSSTDNEYRKEYVKKHPFVTVKVPNVVVPVKKNVVFHFQKESMKEFLVNINPKLYNIEVQK